MPNTAATHEPTTSHKALRRWVEEVAAMTQPDEIHWCDGSAEEYDWLAQTLVDGGHVREALRGQAAELLPGALGPRGRGAGRGPDVHLLGNARSDAGPTNNWCDPDEMRATLRGLFEGSMRGRRMYVVPFSMGPLGSPISYIGVEITDSAYVAASMRHHDAHGSAGARRARRGRELRSVPALGRQAAARLRAGRAVAVQPREQVHRPLPRDARDLVVRLRVRRQRAAGQEVLRAAHRLGDGARRGVAGRAHADPQAHLAGGGRAVRRRARFPAPAARPTSPCSFPTLSGLEGRDDRRRHRLDEVRPRRPPLRGQPRGRLLRRRARGRGAGRTRTRSTRSSATRSSPTAPRPTTATCGGRG